MAHFHHEERQISRRRVDVSVLPANPIIAEARKYTIYEPFLVIEGKRLPAPSRVREKEYLTGFESQSGGIQRFKLGLHGISVDMAAMVGYVQEGRLDAWFVTINGWISELVGTSCSVGCDWLDSDRLTDFADDAGRRFSTSVSRHPRVAPAREIAIHHFWIAMQ